MLKNKEVRELILIEIIVLIIGIVSILLLNKYSYETYKEAIIENNLYIIDSIISKHPELENEVIDGIINHDISASESYEILNKYGLDDKSIKEFRSKIKRVSDSEKESLGSELLNIISKKGFNDDFNRVLELIYNGADIEYKNSKKGDYALLICARKNYIKTFITLIKAGANFASSPKGSIFMH